MTVPACRLAMRIGGYEGFLLLVALPFCISKGLVSVFSMKQW